MSRRSGFEKAPNALTFDKRVSMAGKAAYVIVRHLAYEAGRREEDDEVRLPTHHEIAELADCSPSAMAGYLSELIAAGWIERRGRAQATRYVIYDDQSSSGIQDQAVVESTTASEAGLITQDVVKTRTSFGRTSSAPILRRSNGREPVFDAVAEVCDVDVDAQGSEIGRAVKQINRLAWEEAAPERRAALEGVEEWQALLANEVRRRATLYHRAFGNEIDLTPRALAKWWRDVERRAMRAAGRGLTPAEIAALPLGEESSWR